MADKLPDEFKQFPLIVFLTYLYVLPYPVSTFLRQHNLYQMFVSSIVKINFTGVKVKRILILSLIKLLEIEENKNMIQSIIIFCVDYMKSLIKKKPQERKEIRQDYRRSLNEMKQENTIRKQETQDDNQMTNLFTRFQHPFSTYSQFDQFKLIFFQSNFPVNQISPELRQSIKNVLETEWVENKTRKIVRVKR